MIEIRYGRKNFINLVGVLGFLLGMSLIVLADFLHRLAKDCTVSNITIAVTTSVASLFLLIGIYHLILYRRESKVVGVSPDGLHLSNGKIYLFSEAKKILPLGLLGFRIIFNDGWTYQPAYLGAQKAKEVFDVIRRYIESSPKKAELIAEINVFLKKHHNAGAHTIIIFSAVLMGLPFLPFMSLPSPLPLILVGLVPMVYALYKRFRQAPKSFNTKDGHESRFS
jgi:hypothetical protein